MQLSGHKNGKIKLNVLAFSEMNARTVLAHLPQPTPYKEQVKSLSIKIRIQIMDDHNNKLHIHKINLTAPICQLSALLEFINHNTATCKLI
jgi:hypothetical protein